MEYIMPLIYMVAGAGVFLGGFAAAVYIFSGKDIDDSGDTFFNAPVLEPTPQQQNKKAPEDDLENKNTFYQ